MFRRHQAGGDEGVESPPDLGDQMHALAVELRFVEVALARMRRKEIGGDVLGCVERGIERLARMLGIAGAACQGLDVQPLVKQEREVASTEDLLHRHYFGQRPAADAVTSSGAGSQKAGSACGLPAKRFIVATTLASPTVWAWNIGPPVATGNP